jgi:hypothetical protein
VFKVVIFNLLGVWLVGWYVSSNYLFILYLVAFKNNAVTLM